MVLDLVHVLMQVLNLGTPEHTKFSTTSSTGYPEFRNLGTSQMTSPRISIHTYRGGYLQVPDFWVIFVFNFSTRITAYVDSGIALPSIETRDDSPRENFV